MLKSIRIILWIAVLIALGVLVYSRLANKYGDQLVSADDPSVSSPKDHIAGIFMSPAQTIPANRLHSVDEEWTREDWPGHWSITYFGFTNCPDVCPAALGLLSVAFPKVEQQIPPAEYDRLRGVMITVDPYRDTAEQLKTYTEFYHPKFLGLSGDRAEIDKFAEKFGVFYDYPEGTSSTTNYAVGHSSTYIVINPKGEFQAVLTEHQSADKLADDIARIINYWVATQ